GKRRALQESGEVHLVGGVEHAEVLRCEARELLPPAETGGRSGLRELLGGAERLLHPREELTDLVGEPAETEQTAVGRPRAGVLCAEQFANLRELLGSRKDLRGLALALLEEREGEPVERQDAETRERGVQPGEQRRARVIARATRPHDQCDTFGLGSGLDQPCEPFAERGGLARARRAGDQQGPPRVVERSEERRVGKEG